ncbi:thioesterase superfamily protein [Leptothrix cholodnii SP-6]|uniref:Thioesterase superfamily protein n=1 Tax=Leptothrix cholodnii (strain ATCC 51168 / LMG 8142 / SP-6) TaxID=395495 RepID=B1Y013_LEPCP|nr:YbgC/FadM family acyl-CoA thioesterase [Leptothrix cholodnii]ACB34140.1 thioesterase superfamily protein [Leptothrix cholodnii SP-6]
MSRRNSFRFLHRLRVRWAEVDLQQVVFNGHYLMYFDTAVADYWRALALPYHETMAQLDGDLYVRKATVEYEASARFDDQLEIGVRCERVGNSSITFSCAVFRAEELLVGGELVYVFVDPVSRTSRPVPQALRETLLAYEGGAPMLDVRVGSWAELGGRAQTIRTEVFVHEQRIPAELEWDAADATCVHALAVNRLGMPLATGRLLEPSPGVGRIGRMAVRASMRGGHVGRAVLDALLAAARERGFHEVVLHAQQSAVGFYLRVGFVPRGEAFEEAGILHQEMVRAP